MLTNAAAKAAGARSRAYKLFDQGGLHLFVSPAGTKSWRLKYRWRGREKLLTIGRFPDLNVAQARMRQGEAKELLANGRDPGIKIDSPGGTFEQLARAWYRHGRPGWSSAHAVDVIGSLERDIFPELGERPAGAIAPPELLELLKQVQARGSVATAQRIRQRLSEIYAFGIAEGLVESDPAAKLGAAMRDAPPAQPHPALTQIESCRELLAACEAIDARPATKLASRFLALTAVRLDAVRGMCWDEVDLQARTWTVPAARMKLARAKKSDGRFDHVVPLSAAAIAVLEEAAAEKRYDTHSPVVDPNLIGGSPLVFAGRGGSAPIGEGAIRELYLRTPFAGRHVPHGWRSSFSTILNEQLGEEWRTAIDMALAHSAKGKVEAAYNRAQLLDRRRALMDRWGCLLTEEPV